jgi:hypothetical protein
LQSTVVNQKEAAIHLLVDQSGVLSKHKDDMTGNKKKKLSLIHTPE